MSHTKNERIANAKLALRLMIEELGDSEFDRIAFRIREPRYQDIYSTTWNDLKDSGLIKLYPFCQLTGRGWLEGLETIGGLRTAEMDNKIGRVMANLKDRVKGREKRARTHSQEVAAGAAVSEAFVRNILLSNYIELVLKVKGVSVRATPPVYTIEIPEGFGLPIL